MRRVRVLVTLIVCAQTLIAFTTPVPQSREIAPNARLIQVTSKTITALPTSEKYVVDLTKPNVKYEFDTQMGSIDVNRVEVRTDKGKVAISTWMKKILRADELNGWESRPFTIGTLAPSSTAKTSTCEDDGKCICNSDDVCTCEGSDCLALPTVCKFFTCFRGLARTYCHCVKGL